MIGTRIRQARLAAGLTLVELGAQVGLSHGAIQKYEKGALVPSSSVLLQIAKACGVRVEYFLRTDEVSLEGAEFRRHANFGKQAQEAIRLKVAEAIEKRVELLACFPASPLLHFVVPEGLPTRIDDDEDLERVAERVREAWNVGLDSIGDLTDTFEALGILVVAVDVAHPGFSGMTALARTTHQRDYPVIAVSSRWPGDRQRFTLAHELGHLLLVGRLGAALDVEKACNRFAGAFLAPKAVVVRLLGQGRRTLEWQELYGLKQEFGLSMAGWLYRAKQCMVIDDATFTALYRQFSARGWRREEPGEPVPRETPRLFEQLIYRALGERYLSEAKAAELLGMPLMRFHKERQLESLDAAPHQ